MSWLITTLVTPVSFGVADHVVDVLGRDRIEAGGRLVVEQNLAASRPARAPGPRACACRPTARPGYFFSTFAQAERRRSRSRTISWISAFGQLRVLEQRKGDVLLDGERVEQRRVLEQHAELPAHPVELDVVERHDVLAVDPDLPASGLSRPMRCFISTDLPCPEPPMMMLILPRSMSRSTPRSTWCVAEGLLDAAHPDLAALVRCVATGSSSDACVICAAARRMMSVRK